jgi:TM2 domain-containing membrane protein YozV
MSTRTIAAMLAAYFIPGAGHFYLGFRGRAVAFFTIVVVLFTIGIAIDGGLYSPLQGGGLLHVLAALGSMGSGALYFIAAGLGPHGDLTSITYEYGTAFIISAGLMNLLLVLDTFDLAEGRKL